MNDMDGANNFGCCLERGEGVDEDIERAVFYYREAATQSHRDGLYNFARCLDYGKGLHEEVGCAAKCYRLSAELNDASAQNSFGIFLERGIGMPSNLALAAHYYELAALQGHPDGASNLGFCLEHGRGVKPNIGLAAEYYKFVADHGYPEGDLNYRRCLRLLGRWDAPDRSSDISAHPPSHDDLSRQFIDCLKEPDALHGVAPEVLASIERFKVSTATQADFHLAAVGLDLGSDLGRGCTSIVSLGRYQKRTLVAVKAAINTRSAAFMKREASIHRKLSHPLVLAFRDDVADQHSAIVTEFAANGSLASHLAPAKGSESPHLERETRIARIIVGIVLAMRYVHSRAVIHRNLTPDNIMLDWEWNIRLGDFGNSTSPNAPGISTPADPYINKEWTSCDSHYCGPECYDDIYVPACDVFSFGMIFYELMVGKPAFPRTLLPHAVAKSLTVRDKRPSIPDFVLPEVRKLISDCWARDPADRAPFSQILNRLEEMKFKLTANVNSSKLSDFVKRIKDWEAANVSPAVASAQ
jgi:hypothetical protein